MDLSALIHACTAPQVSRQTMQAIMRVESAHRPHAIGYKVVRRSDGAVFDLVSPPKNIDEAKGMARWFITNGYKFDAGIAQVNSVNFERFGLTPENMFDACTSIRTGSLILHECWQRASQKFTSQDAALGATISCYQSGNFTTGYGTGYVAKVRAAAGAPAGAIVASAPQLRRAQSARPTRPAALHYIPVDPRYALSASAEIASFRNAGASESEPANAASETVSNSTSAVLPARFPTSISGKTE